MYTNAPGDIFKLFGPASEQVVKRRVDALNLRVMEATREILKYYALRVKGVVLDPVRRLAL